MKYIGNKTRLLDYIYQSLLEDSVPIKGTICDIFGGTGSVGRFFKEKGMSVISNDLMTYSFFHQYANVYLNKMPLFEKLFEGGILEVLNYLNNLEPAENGYVFNNFAPSGKYHRRYFSDENAKRIDAIRDKIEDWKKLELINDDEYIVLVDSLVDAADFVANISGTYGAYLKIWRSMALKPLKLEMPNIFSNKKTNHIYQEDANSLIKKIQCDILYIDPPYNERQYAPNFHVLETLTVWDKEELVGKTGQRNYEDKKSLYCLKKEAVKAFKQLIDDAKAKYIVVSYNNEGIIPKEDIVSILKSKGVVTEHIKDYRRFRTEKDNEHRQYKQCDDKVLEHLYVVKCCCLDQNSD